MVNSKGEKMNEKFESKNSVGENNNTSMSSLEAMAGKFDPDKAKLAREEAMEKLNQPNETIISGEASKILKNENGKVRLESRYLDIYQNYKNSANYDEKDSDLSHVIWDAGMGAALLDVDKNIVSQLQNGSEIDITKLDSESMQKFNKTLNAVGKIFASRNMRAAGRAIRDISTTGRVGEFLVEYHKAQKDIETNSKPKTVEQSQEQLKDSPDNIARFNALEQEYAEVTSMQKGRGLDSDAIQSLYSKYSEQEGRMYDPKIVETIKERRNSLANLADDLERIDKIINSTDF